MKYFFYLFLLIFNISCGYPDIDTVPEFKDLKLSEQETIDMCKISSKNKIEIDNCLELLNK